MRAGETCTYGDESHVTRASRCAAFAQACTQPIGGVCSAYLEAINHVARRHVPQALEGLHGRHRNLQTTAILSLTQLHIRKERNKSDGGTRVGFGARGRRHGRMTLIQVLRRLVFVAKKEPGPVRPA